MHFLDNLRVVLVAPRNPLNIGAAARAMTNFGASRLRVVNPYEVAFATARSAVGAGEAIAQAEQFGTVADAVADCVLVVGTTGTGRRGPLHPLHPLRSAAQLVVPALHSHRVALLFGSEKRGLSNQDLTHCHWLLNIPTQPEQPSLNLGQAVAVCLYELAETLAFEARTIVAPALEPPGLSTIPATAAELERLTTVLLGALDLSGYTLPLNAAVTEERVRRLIRRLNPISADAELLLGMLRQILWKLND